MTVRIIVVAIAMVTAVIALASAYPRAAQQPILPTGVYEPCRTRAQGLNAQCFGYVLGIYDAMQAAQANGGTLLGFRACPARGIQDDQLTDVVTRLVTAHTGSPRSSAAGQFAKALAEAFPCLPVTSDEVSRRFRAMPAVNQD
jgi:hypothetical protein